MNPDYAANKTDNMRQLVAKKSHPCLDCGLLWHPAVMTLDHRNRVGGYVNSNGKKMYPNNMKTYDPIAFSQMLSTLDAICMNCHALRELDRDGVLNKPHWQHFTKMLGAGALLQDAA